jgi:hypothetical protein
MTRSIVITVLLCAALASRVPRARAEENASKADDWYGYQALLVDTASWGAMIAGYRMNSAVVFGVGALGAGIGGPIVHGTKGYRGRAALSATARTVAPVLAFVVGSHLGKNSDACGTKHGELMCGFPTGTYVAATTLLAAQALDWIVLGRHRDPAPRAARDATTIRPVLTLQPGGAGLSLAGTF